MYVNGILYIPYKWELQGYSSDNGQALITSECCTSYLCQVWNNNIAMAPKLVVNKNGFIVCPAHNKMNLE